MKECVYVCEQHVDTCAVPVGRFLQMNFRHQIIHNCEGLLNAEPIQRFFVFNLEMSLNLLERVGALLYSTMRG